MIHIGATPGTNQNGCLSLSRECSLARKMQTGLRGAIAGYCVSVLSTGVAGVIKKLGLGTACGYCTLGALAGAVICCTASSIVCHKCCITPQSTDNYIPRRNVPITTESLYLPSTQVIVQQSEERASQTVPGNSNELPGTQFDLPPLPPYSEQTGNFNQPPPPYSEQVENFNRPPPPYLAVAGEPV